MGSAPHEPGAQADEQPQHRVCLTTPFYLGRYELTQAQYRKVAGTNPSYFPGDDRPVEQVSWKEANAFLQKAGHGLRLPSEAEWEFACRAGTTTAYASGGSNSDLSAAGWWGHNAEDAYGNAPDGTSAAGQKKPNAFGLYDMHGNVYEWCADNYLPSYYAASPVMNPPGGTGGDEKVIRGGSWEGTWRHCRSANRNGFHPDSRGYLLGFRVAMSVPPR
jgi:formylglycine-generating enzyme required for sulfatase activity